MLKAISLYQPWASLVAIGAKRNETRSWPISHRGDLAICSTKAFKKEFRQISYHEEPFCSVLAEHHLIPTQRYGMTPENLPCGTVLCVVRVVGVWSTELMGLGDRRVSDQEVAFGDYSAGRYAWVLDRVRVLKTPIPISGHQGLFYLASEIERQVREQL